MTNRFSLDAPGKPGAAIYSILGSAAGFLFFAGSLFAGGLPALTSGTGDLTYDANADFTAYSPLSAVASTTPAGFIFFGTAAPSGAQQVVELNLDGSGDACYSTSCPSTSAQFPAPNFEVSLGGIVFDPYNIVAGTGISSATANFTFSGDITYTSSPTVVFPTVNETATMYTGEDPGGLLSYLFFENADGSFSNELHVTNGTSGSAFINAVMVDPPGSVTMNILGFSSPGANSFLTAPPAPEPATLPLFATAGAVLVLLRRRSRKQPN